MAEEGILGVVKKLPIGHVYLLCCNPKFRVAKTCFGSSHKSCFPKFEPHCKVSMFFGWPLSCNSLGFLAVFPVFHGRFLSDFATKTCVVCEENDGKPFPVRVAKVLVLIPQPNGLLLWREHPKGICIRTEWGLSWNPN